MSEQNVSADQIMRSMKTARTKIHNIESKYGSVDIPQGHPLWNERQKHRKYIDTMRETLGGLQQ